MARAEADQPKLANEDHGAHDDVQHRRDPGDGILLGAVGESDIPDNVNLWGAGSNSAQV